MNFTRTLDQPDGYHLCYRPVVRGLQTARKHEQPSISRESLMSSKGLLAEAPLHSGPRRPEVLVHERGRLLEHCCAPSGGVHDYAQVTADKHNRPGLTLSVDSDQLNSAAGVLRPTMPGRAMSAHMMTFRLTQLGTIPVARSPIEATLLWCSAS